MIEATCREKIRISNHSPTNVWCSLLMQLFLSESFFVSVGGKYAMLVGFRDCTPMLSHPAIIIMEE